MRCRIITLFLSALVFITGRAGEITDTLTIEEIIISGRSSPDIYPSLSRIINTIPNETLRYLPANNLENTLEYVTSLDIRKRGSHGAQADISMRGGSFEQVLLLLNGTAMNDPQTGHHNLNIPVSKADIERIEILRGPGSRIYGPNAFSGAVNIITKEPGGNTIAASIRGGEFGYRDLFASGGFETGTLLHYISAGRKISDGFTENTDFKSSNLFYRLQAGNVAGKFDLQAGHLDKGFGASNFYSSIYPDQYERIRTSFTNLAFSSGSRILYKQSVYWRRHKDRFELFRHIAEPWYKGHNYHMTDIFGSNATLNVPWSLGIYNFGAGVKREEILSSLLGKELGSPRPVKNQTGAFYNYFTRRDQINLTAGNSLIGKRHSVSAGVLLSKTRSSPWGLFGGIDMSYSISNTVKWIMSWNRSLRIPSFTEMYYEGPVHRGNPELEPEKAGTVETGLILQKDYWQGNIVLFSKKGRDIIDWVKRENELIWESRNISVINTHGIEIEISRKIPDKLNLPVTEISAGYAFIDISRQSEDYVSAYVLDHLRHKFVAGTRLSLFRKVELAVMSVYQDRAGTYTDFPSEKETPYRPFILTDIGINYNISEKILLNVEISNIFNTDYADIGKVPVPGRWIMAGINFELSL